MDNAARVQQLEEAIDSANDRINVLGESLLQSINENIAAKAEIRKLTRINAGLQGQIANKVESSNDN